jgi:hypothetical protein
MADILRLAVAIQGVNNFSTAFTQATKGLTGIKAGVAGVSAGLAAAGPMIAFFAAQAAASFVQGSIQVAAEYERNMATVQAVTGATGEEFMELDSLVRELGATTEFTANQAAEAMVNLGRAGFEPIEAMSVLPTVLDLATAAGSELAETSGVLSNVIRAFTLEAEDAVRVGDVLTFTFNNSFTTLESLGQSFKLVAPFAAAAGITFEETASAIGKLGDAGLIGTLAGTGLRQSISKILNPSSEASEAIARLGLEIQVFTELGNEMRQELTVQIPTLDALTGQYNVLSEQTRISALRQQEIQLEIANNNNTIKGHEEAIKIVTSDYMDWENQIGTLRSELLGLKDEMAGFSLDMRKNTLEISEIRQQADRESRDLTEQELLRIEQIGEMNDELRIQRERAAIEQIELKSKVEAEEISLQSTIEAAKASEMHAIMGLQDSNQLLREEQEALNITQLAGSIQSSVVSNDLKLQKEIISELTKVIGTQVTGTENFVTILSELERTGATTSETLNIFATRGGAAILALKEQGVDNLAEFTTSVENSGGVMLETATIMRDTTANEMALMKSAIEGLKIEFGNELLPIVIMVIGAFREFVPVISTWVAVASEMTFLRILFEHLEGVLDVVSPLVGSFGDLSDIFKVLYVALFPIIIPMAIAKNIFELMSPVISDVVDILTPLISKFEELFDHVMVPLQPILDNVIDRFQVWFGVLGPAIGIIFTPMIVVLTTMVDILITVIDLIDQAVSSDLGQSIIGFIAGGGLVGNLLGFQQGTGMGGAPRDDIFYLHRGEIVLNPEESDMFRQLTSGEMSLRNSKEQVSESNGGVSISIGNIDIHADSEEGGRAAARGLLEELRSLNNRGLGEVF